MQMYFSLIMGLIEIQLRPCNGLIVEEVWNIMNTLLNPLAFLSQPVLSNKYKVSRSRQGNNDRLLTGLEPMP